MNQTDKVLYTAAVHTTGGRPEAASALLQDVVGKAKSLAAWCMESQVFRSAPRSSWKSF
jgi:hypothetical protein